MAQTYFNQVITDQSGKVVLDFVQITGYVLSKLMVLFAWSRLMTYFLKLFAINLMLVMIISVLKHIFPTLVYDNRLLENLTLSLPMMAMNYIQGEITDILNTLGNYTMTKADHRKD